MTTPWRHRAAADGTQARADADELPAHPQRWILGTDDGHAELFMTEEGHRESWQRWPWDRGERQEAANA